MQCVPPAAPPYHHSHSPCPTQHSSTLCSVSHISGTTRLTFPLAPGGSPSSAFPCTSTVFCFSFTVSCPKARTVSCGGTEPGLGSAGEGVRWRNTLRRTTCPHKDSLTSLLLMAFPWSQNLPRSQDDRINQLLLLGPWALINVNSLTR